MWNKDTKKKKRNSKTCDSQQEMQNFGGWPESYSEEELLVLPQETEQRAWVDKDDYAHIPVLCCSV